MAGWMTGSSGNWMKGTTSTGWMQKASTPYNPFSQIMPGMGGNSVGQYMGSQKYLQDQAAARQSQPDPWAALRQAMQTPAAPAIQTTPVASTGQVFSPAQTASGISQIRAGAAQAGAMPSLLHAMDQPGVSRSAGTLGRAIFQRAQQRLAGEQDVANLGLQHQLANAQYGLGLYGLQTQGDLQQALAAQNIQGMQQRYGRQMQTNLLDMLISGGLI